MMEMKVFGVFFLYLFLVKIKKKIVKVKHIYLRDSIELYNGLMP